MQMRKNHLSIGSLYLGMSKKRIILLTLALAIVLVGIFSMDRIRSGYMKWRIDSSIETIQSTGTDIVLSNAPEFQGDGLSYNVLAYSEKQFESMRKKSFWKSIYADAMVLLEKRMDDFRSTLLTVRGEEWGTILQDFPVSYGIGDSYALIEEKGSMQLVVILNIEQHKLFILEWLP